MVSSDDEAVLIELLFQQDYQQLKPGQAIGNISMLS